ncbi:MAG: hypothetical protein JNM40_02810 [Myxococcales bacterium]|nr:hypothetical protein [Myxococcales bacterium]
MSERAWQSAGQQLYCVEGDIQWLRLRGVVEESELRTITEQGRDLCLRLGYYIVLCDSSVSTGMSPSARRYNADFNGANPGLLGLSIVYGASQTSRVLLSMLLRGMALLAKNQPRILFAKDEAEAVAMANAERPLLQAEAARRKQNRT